LERIGIVKRRVPAAYVATVSEGMRIPRAKLYDWLRLARATVDRKVAHNKDLNQGESERLLAITHLVGQVDSMVKEGGGSLQFDAGQWITAWLEPISKWFRRGI
jgi:hypothetical protein